MVFHDCVAYDHDDFHPDLHERWVCVEKTHFWYLARRDFIASVFVNNIDMNAKILEVGVGTGSVASKLIETGYVNYYAGDLHLNGMKYATSYRFKELYQFDVLKAPFAEEFDVVCLFDVLEHISEDITVLEQINKMLVKNGKLALTVPAHGYLWNINDVVSGHKRRYDKKSLEKKLEKTGFRVEYSHYVYISMFPLLLFRAIVNRKTIPKKNLDRERNKPVKINRIMNDLLLRLCKFENKNLDSFPDFFGGTLILIAAKI